MKLLNKLFIVGVFILAGLSFTSCRKEKKPTGNIIFKFNFFENGKPVQLDTLEYQNAAGNKYEINDVRYFISDVTFHMHDGSKQTLGGSKFYYYIDSQIPSTFSWAIPEAVPATTYDSISFTFGFSNPNNKINMFVNPPESNMAWPDVLGGGYHYMQMNLKYLDNTNYLQPFNFHLGIGQTRSNDSTITGFVDNSFNVKLPNSSFVLQSHETKEIQIVMNIDRWFSAPNIFNFNNYGMMGIMENQVAQTMARENGQNVFSIGYVK